MGFCDAPGSVMWIVYVPPVVLTESVYWSLGCVVGDFSRNFSTRKGESWDRSESTCDSLAGAFSADGVLPSFDVATSHFGGAGLVEACDVGCVAGSVVATDVVGVEVGPVVACVDAPPSFGRTNGACQFAIAASLFRLIVTVDFTAGLV